MMNTNTNPPLLTARGLAFERQDEWIFTDVSLSVAHGELAMIRGVNGSGKTTLLKILAGLLPPSFGEVSPISVHQATKFMPSVAYLGHQSGLTTDLTVAQNLHYIAKLHGHSDIHAAVQQALTLVGLEAWFDAPVNTLSAGQTKRIALCRVWLQRAVLWLLDEPFANLDDAGVALVAEFIHRHLADHGAVVASTHGVPVLDDRANVMVWMGEDANEDAEADDVPIE